MPKNELAAMPLVDHLRELRTRLIWAVVAVTLGMVLSLAFADRFIEALTAMCVDCGIQVTRPTAGFVSYFQVGLRLGLVLAAPVVLYQIHAFIAPALHPHEKRYLNLFVPGGFALFFAGILFGWFLVLPRTVAFLAQFSRQFGVAPNWTLDEYLALVTNLLLAIGVAFLTPLVVYVLSKTGLVTPAVMARYRRYFVVVAAVLAAVLTPTPDPFTMFMVLIPMLVLYELGILLARLL
jgi:sec-independent protein translocase protein TatC